MSKRVLIVTYDMVPHAFTWGGCQRMYYLSKKLICYGHDVDVFALRAAKYNTYGKEPLPYVIFGEDEPSEKDSHFTDSNTTAPKNKGLKGLMRKLAFKLDPLVFNEITPGNGLLAYKKLKNAKKKLEAQLMAKDYDLVIVSAPPFVVFSSIDTIKKTKHQTKVIMDYRDPWNSWHTGNKLCERREKHLQQKANLVVCTNQALCDDMSKKYHIDFNKYRVVENGFMVDNQGGNSIDVSLSHDKMNVVYTGTISFTSVPDGYRDTKPLFEALEKLIQQGQTGIRLIFIGEANSDKTYLESLKKKFGDNLIIVGKVDNLTAKEFVRQSDVCLLLHTAKDLSGKFLISGKAYDYIQAKKFIFSISRSDSQHASILNQNGVGVNVENECEAISKGLIRIYNKWEEVGFEHVYDDIDIMRFSRDYQLDKYIKIIEEL